MTGWLKVLHIVGIVLWLGGMINLSLILSRTSSLDPEFQQRLAPAVRAFRTGGLWAGAFLVLISGIAVVVMSPEYFKMGWFHAKLTLVLAMLGAQGWLDSRVARWLREPLPHGGSGFSKLYTFALVALFLISFLVIRKPF